jgi:hypothetical protein
MSSDLRQRTKIVLLTNPVAVELSTWIGDFSCGQPILPRVLRSGTISWSVVKSSATYAYANDAIAIFITCAIYNTGPLVCGIGSFLDTQMCDPIRLLDLDSLRNLASECAVIIMLLARYVVPSLGYVAT